jgi:hypothetical protein
LIACALLSIVISGFAEATLYIYAFVLFLLTFLLLRRVRERYSLPSYFGGDEAEKHG